MLETTTKRPAVGRAAALILLGLVGCARGEGPPAQEPGADAEPAVRQGTAVIEREVARIDAAVERIDSVFQPLPLLTPSEEDALRRFLNAQQLASARSLGVGRGLAADSLERLAAAGELVRLEDSDHWVVKDLDYSVPLVVPGVRDLLTELGQRFQRRLAELGAPPLRMEITSVLRSADDQAALRRVNPNAASGESTHEYGTTVDVLYSAYAAPSENVLELDTGDATGVEPSLRRYSDVAIERVAGRRSLELKAILGDVLLQMQREGRVMVTLERQQPVFHITLAR